MTGKLACIALIVLLNASASLAATITKIFLYNNGSYTIVDIPGSTDVSVSDRGALNNSGQFVGTYVDSTGRHSFLYSGGSLQLLPIGAAGALNDSGQIIGTEFTPAGEFAALYSGGQVTLLQPPGTVPGNGGNVALSINNAGEIVGTYQTTRASNSLPHAFLYSGGTYSDISVPGSTSTAPFTINNSGEIAGGFCCGVPINGFGVHGFIDQGGTFTTLNTLALVSFNDSGQGVGTTNDCSGGFLYDNGTVLNFNVPGSNGTGATDINNSGQVIGTFCNGGLKPNGNGKESYLYDNGSYTIINVPTNLLPGTGGIQVQSTTAWSVNDSGEVLGVVTYMTPEPSTWFVLVAGLAGLSVTGLRRRVRRFC